MQKRGNLFVVSGPAGAGKSEIVKKLLSKHDDVRLSVSCTTRRIRAGEIPDVSYHFVSEERFDELAAQDAFYEWAFVHQNRYGTLKSAVEEALAQGHDLILEIDVQGCAKVLRLNPDATSVFVCPPSAENLKKRLLHRGTETADSIRVRLGNVAGEVAHAYDYDYVIIHQDWADVPNALEIAAEDLYQIIAVKRLEKKNRIDFLDSLSASLKGSDTGAKEEETL